MLFLFREVRPKLVLLTERFDCNWLAFHHAAYRPMFHPARGIQKRLAFTRYPALGVPLPKALSLLAPGAVPGGGWGGGTGRPGRRHGAAGDGGCGTGAAGAAGAAARATGAAGDGTGRVGVCWGGWGGWGCAGAAGAAQMFVQDTCLPMRRPL